MAERSSRGSSHGEGSRSHDVPWWVWSARCQCWVTSCWWKQLELGVRWPWRYQTVTLYFRVIITGLWRHRGRAWDTKRVDEVQEQSVRRWIRFSFPRPVGWLHQNKRIRRPQGGYSPARTWPGNFTSVLKDRATCHLHRTLCSVIWRHNVFQSGEWIVENAQTAQSKGFSIEPMKSSVEVGSSKPITFTWTPPSDHDVRLALHDLMTS